MAGTDGADAGTAKENEGYAAKKEEVTHVKILLRRTGFASSYPVFLRYIPQLQLIG